MENPLKKEEKTSSILIGSVAFLIGVLFDIGIPYFFEEAAGVRNIIPALIIGLTFYIVNQIRILTDAFKTEHQSTMISLNSTYNATRDVIMSLLKLERKIYKDVRFIKYLEALAHSAENIEDKPKLTKKYFYELLEEYISLIKGISEGAAVRFITYESERIARINRIIEEAENDIYAVTYDVDDYLINFWAGEDLDKYIDLNKRIANKNVVIKRIFVIDENFDNNSVKENLIIKIKNKCDGIQNMTTKFIKRDLAEKRHKATSSFILIDNEIASESSTGKRALRNKRYISFSSQEINDELYQRFKILDGIESMGI